MRQHGEYKSQRREQRRSKKHNMKSASGKGGFVHIYAGIRKKAKETEGT